MCEQTMQELMTEDVLIVYQADNMQDVYPQLSGRPERFVVILDDEDVPTHLTTANDLKRKMPRSLDWPNVIELVDRLPEALLVDEAVTLERAMVFYQTIGTMTPQPTGLVVMRDDQAVGVLPYTALVEYFNDVTIPALEAQGIPKERAVGTPQTIANAVFCCRRHPRCKFEVTAPLVDEPPLCGLMAAHGRTRLKA